MLDGRTRMEVTSERLEKNTVLLEVKIEEEQFSKAVDRAYRKVAKDVMIPGFRKGRVPRVVLERYVGKDKLYEEAASLMLGEAYPAAVKDAGIEPVSQPEVEIVQAEEGKPLVFKAKVEVKPEVELGEYKRLEVVRPEVKVTPEDVDIELERLRDRYARLTTVEDGVVTKGDIVTIDYEGTVERNIFPGGFAKGREIEAGMGYLIPGVDEALIGMGVGEKKKVTVRIPADYPDSSIADKEAVFQLSLKSIRRRNLMPIDDDFAKEVSEFDTLEELKVDVENKLRQAKNEQAEQAVRQEIVSRVAENAKVEIPSSMVNNQVEEMVEDMVTTAEGRGVEPERLFKLLNASPDEMRERMRPDAEQTLKTRLVLDAVVRAEELTVGDEEVKEEINRFAGLYRQDPEELYRSLEEGGRLDVVKQKLLREKAVKLLVDSAVVKEAAETKEVLEPEPVATETAGTPKTAKKGKKA